MSQLIKQLEQLGVSVDPQLFSLALIHRSYAYENGQIPTNERLEFLGDAVLEIIVTDYLYRKFPDSDEGNLAKVRSAAVSAVGLAEIARELDIGSLVKLGKGEIATGGNNKTSILADTTEAIIGAIYLSSGMEAVTKFVRYNIDPKIERAASLGSDLDPKTALQELCVKINFAQPKYLVEETGPDHHKLFFAKAEIAGVIFGEGNGSSKKHAEQLAATNALAKIREDYNDKLDRRENSEDAGA